MITILTPTYNRAYCLTNLYESIKKQSSGSFEWIIIDDGSTDGTENLVQQWINEHAIVIKYFKQNNFGKHVALNHGVTKSAADWIFIVDSDDEVSTDAIARIEEQIDWLPEKYTGLCFRKMNLKHELLGKSFDPRKIYIDTHPTDAAAIFEADLMYVFKKTMMEKKPFPVIANEKFVPELFVWNAIGDLGLIRYFLHKIIVLGDYLPDGLSQNFKSQLKNNPKGFALFYKDQRAREKRIIKKIKCTIRYIQCVYYLRVKRN